jgi:hypothetical protein
MTQEKQLKEGGEVKNFSVIAFSLTFTEFGKFGFEFNRTLSKELKNRRREYYGLKQEEREAQEDEFRFTMLSNVLRSRPTGLEIIGYPVLDEKSNNEKTMKEDFLEFFKRPENEDLLDYVWTIYQERLYPNELMSNLSN